MKQLGNRSLAIGIASVLALYASGLAAPRRCVNIRISCPAIPFSEDNQLLPLNTLKPVGKIVHCSEQCK